MSSLILLHGSLPLHFLGDSKRLLIPSVVLFEKEISSCAEDPDIIEPFTWRNIAKFLVQFTGVFLKDGEF